MRTAAGGRGGGGGGDRTEGAVLIVEAKEDEADDDEEDDASSRSSVSARWAAVMACGLSVAFRMMGRETLPCMSVSSRRGGRMT